jgi:hypothetical protein
LRKNREARMGIGFEKGEIRVSHKERGFGQIVVGGRQGEE